MNKTNSSLLAGTAVLTAAILGARNGPQQPATATWYALLRKPGYTPPGPLIGGVWGILELLLSVAGYRLWRAPATPNRSAALVAWTLTLTGLAGYPWLFFRQKRLAASTAASCAMFAGAAGTAIAAKDVDETAAAMTVPLLLWLAFATVLSEELWRRNPLLSRD